MGSGGARRIASTWVSAGCALALGAGCASFDPFEIPADELRQRVDTVVVPPLVVERGLADPERLRAWIEPRVVQQLEEGGFEVVPPEEWDRRWLAIAREVGEIWDPKTGVRDDARHAAVLSTLRHDLAVERGVDAVVRVSLYSVALEAGLRRQTLCGAPLDLYWPSRVDPLGRSERATIALGACLQALVHDLDDRKLYGIREGLEFEETYARQTHASRPLDERLLDRERIEQAIDEVVGPLATRGRR